MKILLVVYDNDMFIHVFPTGLAYVAAVLLKKGYEVEIYNQDVHHYPEEHLTAYLNKNHFDVVGLGVIAGYYQYGKLLKISQAINASKQRPFFVLGGHGPSPEPEYFLRKTGADAVVIGEGESTIVELIDSLAAAKNINGIAGLAVREGNNITVNKRRPLIKDIDSIPFPAYHLFPMEYYRLLRDPNASKRDFVIPMLSGRGCPFCCTFCYRMDEGLRTRAPEAIVEEIKLLKRDYGITYISFYDELLMSSQSRMEKICREMLKNKLDVKWYCNGRLNYAKPALLGLMKKAGCVFINYGIEALDDQVLKNINKCLTVSQIESGIKATLEAGISPGFNIMFGNIGDNMRTLNRAVDFLIKHDDGAQLRTIRPVTPYPGSPLYYHAIKTGLLRDCGDFYERKHVNSDLVSVNFTKMSDKKIHRALFDANRKLIKNYFAQKNRLGVEEAKDLYLNRNAEFRGFRQT
ncbi:MAG TPA: B12-binding domain-containing radical SAM protein [Elusimicrobia bacterium]|nr:B12-binding domain-containing radical SAM protein [Elusimicrobiota bacterium]